MSDEHRRIVATLYAVNYRSEISAKVELESLTVAYDTSRHIKWLCRSNLGIKTAVKRSDGKRHSDERVVFANIDGGIDPGAVGLLATKQRFNQLLGPSSWAAANGECLGN